MILMTFFLIFECHYDVVLLTSKLFSFLASTSIPYTLYLYTSIPLYLPPTPNLNNSLVKFQRIDLY
jgi:hypothetical protein